MKTDKLIEVKLMGIEASPMEYVIFLGTEKKVFSIFVGADVGSAILMMHQGIAKPRPLTHDLIGNILLGLGVSVDKIVINDVKNNTFYARLFLMEQNELGKKIVEVDARPSDSIVLAIKYKTKVYVTEEVFGKVEDVSKYLEQKRKKRKE